MVTYIWHIDSVLFYFFHNYLSTQDTQEFLRCFMDQLHEELKATVITDMLDSEEEGAPNGTSNDIDDLLTTAATTQKEETPDPQPQAETNSQSDTDYETCDSGMSSERSSVEHNVSSDEGTDSNTDLAKNKIAKNKSDSQAINKNVQTPLRRSKRDKNCANPDENLINDTLSNKNETGPIANSLPNIKDLKESANKNKQASKLDTGTSPAGGDGLLFTREFLPKTNMFCFHS